MSRLNLAVTLSVGTLGILFAPALAEAHFELVAPTSWWTQDAVSSGGPQKTPPCGNETVAGTSATGVVNVYQSGQPVTITVMSTIAHPGWWRISLHQGAAATQTSTTLPEPPELGGPGTAQQCTPAFINNPVWSPTQPVIADKLGIPANNPTSTTTVQSGTQNYQVMIPAAAQCSMASPCTLQVLMIMTDHSFPTCNYHHCANMALAGSATGTGGMSGTVDAGAKDASAGTGGKTGAGGSTATGAGGSSNGTAGMTGNGQGGAIAGTGGATGGGVGGSTTTGAGGEPTGGQGTGGAGGSSDKASGGCAIGGSAVGSSGGLIFLAILALRRRRAKK